jgi:hypothetical protein
MNINRYVCRGWVRADQTIVKLLKDLKSSVLEKQIKLIYRHIYILRYVCGGGGLCRPDNCESHERLEKLFVRKTNQTQTIHIYRHVYSIYIGMCVGGGLVRACTYWCNLFIYIHT